MDMSRVLSTPTSSSADVLARVADGWRSIAGWFRMVPSARLRGRDADPGAGAGADMGAGPGTSAGATAGARAGTAATAGAGAGSAELASAAAEGGVGAGAGAGAGTPTQTRLGNGFDHAGLDLRSDGHTRLRFLLSFASESMLLTFHPRLRRYV